MCDNDLIKTNFCLLRLIEWQSDVDPVYFSLIDCSLLYDLLVYYATSICGDCHCVLVVIDLRAVSARGTTGNKVAEEGIVPALPRPRPIHTEVVTIPTEVV